MELSRVPLRKIAENVENSRRHDQTPRTLIEVTFAVAEVVRLPFVRTTTTTQKTELSRVPLRKASERRAGEIRS